MDTNIWTILVAAGLPSAIVAGVVGLFFRRVEKRLDREHEARKAQEAARIEFEGFLVDGITATMKLSEANALALQHGRCNGETHAALDYMREVKRKQRKFFQQQGLENIFSEED
jgi:hypothetical protein